jgi:hypothetical protein
MMRRAYTTDLSDAEWGLIEPHLPAPKAPGRPRLHPLREILDAVFYIGYVAAAPGGSCPTTSHLGRASTIISVSGASTAPGKGSTRPSASVCGSASGEILNPARGSSILSR